MIIETVLKTAPTAKPISIEDAKYHCNIELENTDHDIYIETLIDVAVKHVESILWRKLITQTWYAYLDGWPCGDYIELPFGKLQSVIAIKYTDVDNNQSTWTSSEYIVGTKYRRGRITLANGYTWPNSVLYPSSPIEIEYICGYGANSSFIPEEIKHAIKIIIADLFENRENSIIGMSYVKLDTVANLINEHRLNEL